MQSNLLSVIEVILHLQIKAGLKEELAQQAFALILIMILLDD